MTLVLNWSQAWCESSRRFFQVWPGCCAGEMSVGIIALASLEITIQCGRSRQLSTCNSTFAVVQCRFTSVCTILSSLCFSLATFFTFTFICSLSTRRGGYTRIYLQVTVGLCTCPVRMCILVNVVRWISRFTASKVDLWIVWYFGGVTMFTRLRNVFSMYGLWRRFSRWYFRKPLSIFAF